MTSDDVRSFFFIVRYLLKRSHRSPKETQSYTASCFDIQITCRVVITSALLPKIINPEILLWKEGTGFPKVVLYSLAGMKKTQIGKFLLDK